MDAFKESHAIKEFRHPAGGAAHMAGSAIGSRYMESTLKMGQSRCQRYDFLGDARRSRRRRAGLIVLAAAAIIVTAYFAIDHRSMAHTFTEGRVDIKLSNDGAFFSDSVAGTWVSPGNWAPGDELTASLHIRNYGNDPIAQASVDWINPDFGDPNLLDKIQVRRWRESGSGGDIDRLAQYGSACDSNGDGVLSAMELIEYGSVPLGVPSFTYGANAARSSGAALTPGGEAYVVEMTFRFMEDAGNEYQGASASFDLLVAASGGGDHGSDDESGDD